MTEHESFTRRSVLKASAAALGGLGATGIGASAPSCVQTTTKAKAYDQCPAISYVTTVAEGRSGFVGETCEDDGVKYSRVDFDCTDTWWIRNSDLTSANDCFC